MFVDRRHAGRRLGALLALRHISNPLVLALPRGGVEVGYEIAATLRAPLDVIPARKLGAPGHAELAIGAIAPGSTVLNSDIIEHLGIARDAIEQVIADETREMDRRATLFRSGRPPLAVTGHTVIVADDGLATGATALAAIQSVRQGEPLGIILAVPVGAGETVERLTAVASVVALEVPADFRAVGEWYDHFPQTTDDEVIELLQRDTTDGK
jgi:putative phosphoribosyl transferase